MNTTANPMRLIIIGALVLGAFFGAYRFALARNGSSVQTADFRTGATQAGNADPSASGTPGCSCCGSSAPTENGLTGEFEEGTATVEGDVQKIDIDLSQGFYSPNQIVLKAGVPAEITFGQSSGCTAQVMSNELGFFEDLSAGPKTVKVPAPEAGEYPFYCGMQMVYGKIVVK